jgi:hypothetical protein
MLSSLLGIVDCQEISLALRKVRRGEEVPMIALKRALFMEDWLKDLRALGIVNLNAIPTPKPRWPAFQGYPI